MPLIDFEERRSLKVFYFLWVTS